MADNESLIGAFTPQIKCADKQEIRWAVILQRQEVMLIIWLVAITSRALKIARSNNEQEKEEEL